MKKCKFYSDYICNHYGNGLCHYAEKVFGYSLPDSCNHINDFENCTCFEPLIKYEKESSPSALKYDKAETGKLMPDNGIDKRTLTIQNCDKIILKPKSLEVEVKIEKDNFDDFDFIEINGHKFKKV